MKSSPMFSKFPNVTKSPYEGMAPFRSVYMMIIQMHQCHAQQNERIFPSKMILTQVIFEEKEVSRITAVIKGFRLGTRLKSIFSNIQIYIYSISQGLQKGMSLLVVEFSFSAIQRLKTTYRQKQEIHQYHYKSPIVVSPDHEGQILNLHKYTDQTNEMSFI